MTISSNAELRHQLWRQEVLKLIRITPDASRISIKRQSGLSMESTLAVVDQLLEEGLIVSVGKQDSARAGRKATLLSINSESRYFIGVRFSAERVIAMCMDFGLQPVGVCRLHYDAPPEAERLIEDVCGCIRQLMEELGENSARLSGIGVGAPGLIDLEQGMVKRYSHIPTLKNIPLRDLIQQRFGVPVYLEHGVKCSARAFLSMPEHAASRDWLFVQVSRGVNLCVIMNGKIHSGFQYLSGEIGHLLCEGGETLESLAASDSLCKKAKKAVENGDERFAVLRAMGEENGMEALVKAEHMGCEGSRALLAQAGEAVGDTLASAIMLLNPQEIILCGAHSASPAFVEALRAALRANCLPESLACMQLHFAPDDPVLDARGVALLPYQKQFDNQQDLSLS